MTILSELIHLSDIFLPFDPHNVEWLLFPPLHLAGDKTTKTQTTSSIACRSPASDGSMPQAHFIVLANQATLLSRSVKRSSENLCLVESQILGTPRQVRAKSKTLVVAKGEGWRRNGLGVWD